jgi:hypothetical protein
VNLPNVDTAAKESADRRLGEIESHFGADVIALIGPILWGWENLIRSVVEELENKKPGLVVVLDTPGGIAEVVERIVRIFRHHYKEVKFLIPDKAFSAGTILVMSGDEILMDYHSCLGPIDPQVQREGKLVPALSYLKQFDRLKEKTGEGKLSTAEVVLLEKMDLAELHQFELARDFSVTLLKEWLAKYKFKDWKFTETRKIPVTDAMKAEQAEAIARILNDHERWHTHGRGIDMKTLRDVLKLRIDDYGEDQSLKEKVLAYFWLLRDHMGRHQLSNFVHTRKFF